MQVKAHAKLNWYLDITGKRADGYHLLDMLNQRLALHDTLTFEPGDALSLTIAGNDNLPTDNDNLVLCAAHALAQHAACGKGAHIHLIKRIPSGAGLGGGSADAAATLLALNQLWQLDMSLCELQALGESLGADIPYCLAGGLKRVQGIGEQIEPVSVSVPSYNLLILQPAVSLATRDVFQAFQQKKDTELSWTAEEMLEALRIGNLATLRNGQGNRLQQAASRRTPQITQAITDLYQYGATFAQMTGSGSAVYGVFDNQVKLASAQRALTTRYQVCLETSTIDY
jgi:4-diphosphocytidyl-2-C-methyl-D-erythritol kinase